MVVRVHQGGGRVLLRKQYIPGANGWEPVSISVARNSMSPSSDFNGTVITGMLSNFGQSNDPEVTSGISFDHPKFEGRPVIIREGLRLLFIALRVMEIDALVPPEAHSVCDENKTRE